MKTAESPSSAALANPSAFTARAYRRLFLIRRVEEEIARIYPTDKIKSPVHLSIGQEAVSVGVCEALREDDIVFGTYRSHALYLAKGGDLDRMIAELYGKSTGCARGKGGSMHLVDVEQGVMGTSAIVGTGIPNAVGYAYALKLRRRDSIVACFFGDGATEEGVFCESLNFAALKRLPVLLVCENNGYAIHSAQRTRQASDNLVERVRSYGIAAERIEDNDVVRIYERAGEAVQRIRTSGEGPVFLECMTYRWREHVGPNEDYDLGYRMRSEAEPWMQHDQLRRMAGLIPVHEARLIELEVESEIARAFSFAESSPWPAKAELLADVFKEP